MYIYNLYKKYAVNAYYYSFVAYSCDDSFIGI